MPLLHWSLLVQFVFLCSSTYGIRLTNCTERGWVEVVETDTDVPFLCDQLDASDTVQWKFYVPASTNIGTCRPVGQGCDDVTPHRMTRPDDSTTVFYLAAASRLLGSFDLACRVIGSAGSESRCQLNIIHPGSVTSSDCRVNVMTSVDPWTVGGECQIKDAFSSRDFYNCTWSETSSLGAVIRAPDVQSNDQSSAPSGQTYNYTCRFQTALRQQSATYTYTMTVFPGGQTVTAGSLRIVEPSVPQPGCRDGYYREGETLNCTCTLDTPGIPAASVLWLNSATSGPTLQRVVTSQDHNRQLTCQARWGSTTVQQTDYTIRVAFGPKTVTLSDPGAFDLHPVSPGQLTLTCTALTFNPGVTFTWRGGQCSGTTGSTCRFTPTPNSNGDVITCTATNNVTGEANSSNSLMLDIQSPPPGRPVISGYSGQALYEGTTTDVTCTVTGGNPPVSAVTLTCGGQGREVRGTNSTVSLTANRTMQGDNCTCSARWKNHNSDWYPLTARVTIKVYYPPPRPTISSKTQQYPFLAGQPATLYCGYSPATDRGNPPATLTWQGHTGSSGQGEISLPLTSLTASDNGRRFVCEARNDFTQDINTPVTTTTQLQVYFLSQVSVSTLDNNDCVFADTYTCHVRDGQRVRLNCSADSNPPLATVAWQSATSSVLDLVADRDTNVNHTCRVITEKRDDSRLPLEESATLWVLVTYDAVLTELTCNQQAQNLTVKEGDPVDISCTARGRPTPAISITRDGTRLQHTPQGHVTPQDHVTLTNMTSRALCHDAGLYTCQLTQGDGDPYAQMESLSLFVNCTPRTLEGNTDDLGSFNFVDQPVDIPVTLTAYPTPDSFTAHYLGQAGNLTQDVTRSTVNVSCGQTRLVHTSDCNIRVSGLTSRTAGQYSVLIANDAGGVALKFHMTFQGQENVDGPNNPGPSSALIGGVVAAVAAVSIVVIVAIVVVRKRKRPTKSHKRHGDTGHGLGSATVSDEVAISPNNTGAADDDFMRDNPAYVTSGDLDFMKDNPAYVTSGDLGYSRETAASNDYEIVDAPGKKPRVKPKPTLAKQITNFDGRNIGSDEEQIVSQSAVDDVYAKVDKSKVHSAQNPATETSGIKNRGVKETKTTGGGAKRKKENTKGSSHGGSPLSMNPPGPKVYENVTFARDEEHSPKRQSAVNAAVSTNGSTVNTDNLVYTTIAFTKEQQKKAEEPPPDRETVEYVGIDFTRNVPKE